MSNYQNYTSNGNFEQLNSNISTSIYKIRQNVNQFVQLSKQIGTSKDTSNLRLNIHNIFQSTNETIKQTSINLKKLSNLKTSESELSFAKSKRAFESELENYSRLQKEVSDKLRQTLPFSAQDINPFSEENNDEEVSEQTTLLKQKRLTELDEKIEFVQDRETKIKQIESDILDINSIMQDLASMVNEQNSLIDNITSNVENTASNVESGNRELIKAAKYATSSRKKLLFLILIIIIIIVAVGLIIFFSIRH